MFFCGLFMCVFSDLELWVVVRRSFVSLVEFFTSINYTPAPRRGRGVYCFTSVRLSVRPSILRPSKIFFVAFFSVTVDGRNLILGH